MTSKWWEQRSTALLLIVRRRVTFCPTRWHATRVEGAPNTYWAPRYHSSYPEQSCTIANLAPLGMPMVVFRVRYDFIPKMGQTLASGWEVGYRERICQKVPVQTRTCKLPQNEAWHVPCPPIKYCKQSYWLLWSFPSHLISFATTALHLNGRHYIVADKVCVLSLRQRKEGLL